MDLNAFYGVVSAINFTLLGLWWVAMRDRPEVGDRGASGRRMAYLVSLQFLIPGTMALLSQVAPDVPALWRSSFAIAGIAGAIGVILLAPMVDRIRDGGLVAAALRFIVAPLYAVVAVVALFPGLPKALHLGLTPLQVEGILLCLLVFLGVQIAWAVHMAPRPESES
ncbi:cytochrome bd-type quinol oxidase subunit 2 [Allocatelliglobosispora scoriae]|uniref:Cytochrome bd-type quinol oxidase subunit 2 n=1 Tax=Allocatelliglobosispora scoriae TaxID=643052 RepID=A0A841BQ99_9ACTN|nr:hypothetical protein [Allocatelliglobosispora scoriae]MBB5869486.1 cytochrome bd-type quinol oxidase subunit 2 [Allocatelliglobosispora scoriae]